MPEFDLSSFLNDTLVFRDVRSVKFPKGKTYTATSLPHREKLALMALSDMGREHGQQSEQYLKAAAAFFVNDKGEPITALERLIGSKLFKQMVTDEVPTAAMDAAETLAIATYTADADTALAWLAVQTGKALAGPNREQRRAAAKKSTGSSRKAGSSTTRQPASRATARKSSATPARTAARASTSGRATSGSRSKAS